MCQISRYAQEVAFICICAYTHNYIYKMYVTIIKKRCCHRVAEGRERDLRCGSWEGLEGAEEMGKRCNFISG